MLLVRARLARRALLDLHTLMLNGRGPPLPSVVLGFAARPVEIHFLEPCWNLLEPVGPSRLCLLHLKFASAPIWLLGQQWSSVIARGRNLFASTQLIRLQFSSKGFEKPIAKKQARILMS